jgi:hypothetical protein
MLALDVRLESLDSIEEELKDELDSDVEEDADDSGTNDEIASDDIDSLMIKLVLGMDVVDVDEGKGITHPVKINAKNRIAMPTNRNNNFLFMTKFYTLSFTKKEAFSCSEGLKNL